MRKHSAVAVNVPGAAVVVIRNFGARPDGIVAITPDVAGDKRVQTPPREAAETSGREHVARSQTGHNENGLKPITVAALNGLQVSHRRIHIPAHRFGSPHLTPRVYVAPPELEVYACLQTSG